MARTVIVLAGLLSGAQLLPLLQLESQATWVELTRDDAGTEFKVTRTGDYNSGHALLRTHLRIESALGSAAWESTLDPRAVYAVDGRLRVISIEKDYGQASAKPVNGICRRTHVQELRGGAWVEVVDAPSQYTGEYFNLSFQVWREPRLKLLNQLASWASATPTTIRVSQEMFKRAPWSPDTAYLKPDFSAPSIASSCKTAEKQP